ncbi:MAG: hypothetical protein AM326_12320 [Candidatus Thorarchaeota archaeon SMTZ-45]|nr:MAG: hypothetical protein AM326_12320 [Candidatus Thorarchaeota archaeon SMTZ-45]
MGKINRAKFKSDRERTRFTGRAKFLGLKKLGEVKGYLHPRIDLWERFTHGGLPTVEYDKSKDRHVPRTRRWNCLGTISEEVPNDKCPVCLLQEFSKLKIEQGTDKKEIILDGGEKARFSLYDLAGEGGYWTDPKAKQETVFVWIPSDAKIEAEFKDAIRPESGPQALGAAIIDVIDEEKKERGNIAGDPCIPGSQFELKLRKGKMVLIDGSEGKADDVHDFNPYPFKLKYDEKALPQDMYKAYKLDRDLAPLTDDIVQLMLASKEEIGIDMEKLTKPTDASRMMDGLRTTWISRSVPFEEFEEFVTKKRGSKPIPQEKPSEGAEESSDLEERYCPGCETITIGRGKFCPRCGTLLKKKEKEEEKPKKAFCPKCGSEVGDAAFCPQCGGKIGGEEEKKAEEKPAESSKPTESKEGASGGKGIRVKCKECKEEVDLMMPSCRCPICGCQHLDVKEQIPPERGDNDVPF